MTPRTSNTTPPSAIFSVTDRLSVSLSGSGLPDRRRSCGAAESRGLRNQLAIGAVTR